MWSVANAIGYRLPGGGERFAVKKRSAVVQAPSAGFHLAFAAPSRAAVDAFWQAACAAGARDNGQPGLRPRYEPDYYAAFVFDLDGFALEAVYKG